MRTLLLPDMSTKYIVNEINTFAVLLTYFYLVIVDISHLGDLVTRFHEFAEYWRKVGRRLGVPENELNLISRPPDYAEKMCQVLFQWVKRPANAKDPTLKCLCEALKSAPVGEGDLSRNIKGDPDIIVLLSTGNSLPK